MHFVDLILEDQLLISQFIESIIDKILQIRLIGLENINFEGIIRITESFEVAKKGPILLRKIKEHFNEINKIEREL